jgi:hypothetical protein
MNCIKNLTFFLSLLILIAIISSCHCDKQECLNEDWQSSLIFQGFTDSEAVPIILKSYQKGTNFTILLDSVSYSSPGQFYESNNSWVPIYTFQAADTTDYVVYLPHSGLYYYLTSMNFNVRECEVCLKRYPIHKLTSVY